MFWKKRVLPAATIVLSAACSDIGAPSADEIKPNMLRWAADAPVRFTAPPSEGQVHAREYGINASLGGLPGLPPEIEQYELAFWAVRGEDREVQINYVLQDDEVLERPFLRFTVPAGALAARPNGTPFAEGDSVLITVIVNDQDLKAHMYPSGLTFDASSPAVLTMWYTGADDDFNADGSVDQDDEYIEENELGIWTRQNILDPWEWIPSETSTADDAVTAWIEHFSGYAVSW